MIKVLKYVVLWRVFSLYLGDADLFFMIEKKKVGNAEGEKQNQE